jgi:WD40 repeat protein
VLALASDLRTVLRASKREQLRSSALQWEDEGRAPDLLWGRDMLVKIEHQVRREDLSGLECSFIADSQRRARRIRWVRRSLVALAVMSGFGVLLMRTRMTERQAELQAELQTRLAQEQTRAARELAETRVTESEREQGRGALLHGEMAEALQHLSEAWRRGDRSSTTEFMLARALEPRLAELAKFSPISRRMWSAAWSPDGSQIATADDGGAQVWSADNYQLLFQMPSESVRSVVYSTHGTRLVTAGLDGVRIWNAATGSLVRELRRSGQSARVQLAAVSADGELVATLDIPGELTDVWRTDTGVQLAELRNVAAGTPSLAFSADGRWLATCGGDHVKLVDTTSWQAVPIPVRHVRALSFDSTGPRLAIATADGGASVWALPKVSLVHQLREIGEPIDRIAWSQDGRLLATAGRDGAELVWDVRSGSLVSQGNHLHDRISSIEFDPASRFLLAAGRRVIVSDAEQGIALASLDGPQAIARFDQIGRRIVGASMDGTARIWDSSSPYRRWSSPPIADSCSTFAGTAPDQRYLPIACPGYPTRVWDTARDQLLAELPSVSAPGGDFAPVLPVVSSDGIRAAIAHGNAAEVYELPGGRLVRTVTHGAAVSAVAFGGSGQLVSGDVAGGVIVTSGDRQDQVMVSGGIDAIAMLADGRVVVADAARHLRVLDQENLTITDLKLPERVGLLRPSPDARRLVTVPSSTIPSRNGAIDPAQLWDLEARRPVTPLAGHVGRTISARWASTDEILTAGSEGTARSWDGATGRQRQLYRSSALFLADVARDGDLVVGGDGDGVLHFWDAASGAELWTLQGHRPYVAGIHVEGYDLVTRDFGGGVSRWSLPPISKVLGEAVRRSIVVP